MDSIVIIRLGRLGDVTLTGPTVKNLRFLYPDAAILFVTRRTYVDLTEMIPGVDRILPFPDNGSYFDLLKLSSDIDGYEPQLVVDLHKNFRSFHLSTMTKAPYKVVYHKRRKERLAAVHDKKFIATVPHTVDLYNDILTSLKGDRLARLPDLALPEAVIDMAAPARQAVAVVPGASSPVKTWPTERFAAVAERLAVDFKLPIMVFLGPNETDLEKYFDVVPDGLLTVYHNHPLPDIASLLSTCRMTLTNDSGLMHVSAAVGTPTVALFGPTHEQLGFYPLGLHDLLLGTDETCRPCSLHGNKACYREEQYCFTLLTVEKVHERAAKLLDSVNLSPAVFIDRDGTLIVDKHYLANPDDIEFLPGTLDAVSRLKKAGYKIILISNQSGVARGFFPIETVEKVNRVLMEKMAAADCQPDEIRICPHHPDGDVPEYTGVCDCRKPKGGMLEAAVINLHLDTKRSYVIGDKYSDLLCGNVLGMRSLLVRTGKGAQTETELPSNTYLRPYHIGDDLPRAIDYIISRS